MFGKIQFNLRETKRETKSALSCSKLTQCTYYFHKKLSSLVNDILVKRKISRVNDTIN